MPPTHRFLEANIKSLILTIPTFQFINFSSSALSSFIQGIHRTPMGGRDEDENGYKGDEQRGTRVPHTRCAAQHTEYTSMLFEFMSQKHTRSPTVHQHPIFTPVSGDSSWEERASGVRDVFNCEAKCDMRATCSTDLVVKEPIKAFS